MGAWAGIRSHSQNSIDDGTGRCKTLNPYHTASHSRAWPAAVRSPIGAVAGAGFLQKFGLILSVPSEWLFVKQHLQKKVFGKMLKSRRTASQSGHTPRPAASQSGHAPRPATSQSGCAPRPAASQSSHNPCGNTLACNPTWSSLGECGRAG